MRSILPLACLFAMLLSAPAGVFAQRTEAEIIANRNESLELLVLDYKEQISKANIKIAHLNKENASLRQDISAILRKADKSAADISRLQTERQRLLANSLELEKAIESRENTIKALQELNRKLQNDNARLTATNNLLEEAVMVSDTIQKYQTITILQQQESINRLMENYTQKCTEITGQFKVPMSKDRVEVLLEAGKSGNVSGKQIESLKLRMCYQMNNEEAVDRIIVYFTLYDNDGRRVARQVPFPLPRVSADQSVSYYEGIHELATTGKFKLQDNTRYYYEIKYREQVVAKGIINPS